jgi:hypothetical protein
MVRKKMSEYLAYLESKLQRGADARFDPMWIPDFLFDFQKSLVTWSLQKGRCALFEDCGLGKTPQQLVWAENIARKSVVHRAHEAIDKIILDNNPAS